MRYVGPCKLPCPQRCDVPDGVTVALVPPTRHKWSDCFNCPNEGCGQAVLILDRPAEVGAR
jgi:hypothetical protein